VGPVPRTPGRRALCRLPRTRAGRSRPLRDRRRRHLRKDLHGRRCPGRVHHHERREAVRARSRRRRRRPAAGARPRRCQRHGVAVQRDATRRRSVPRSHQPDGERGRYRDDQPGPRRVGRGPLGTPASGTRAVRRAGAGARPVDARLGPGRQPPEPGARQPARECRSAAGRSGGSGGALHAPELCGGDGRRPRRHGCHPRRRWREPGDRRGGRDAGDRAGRAGDDDGRRHVRDVRRLAARRRRPRQERHRRRDHQRGGRQGLSGLVRPSARRRGQHVRGGLVARYLTRALGLDMLASAPGPTHTGSS
jgi:hypothetical protein